LSASQFSTESAIERLTVDPTEAEKMVYDLMGRRVAAPAKGRVYIVNGQKVVW
jgi:hypothetical protein